MIKLLIADDHAFVRQSLQDLFAQTDDIQVVAACVDGSEVVDAAERTDPDVALLDITMPHVNGLEAARGLLAARPLARVVMLTASVDFASVCAAQAIGVMGFLLKGDDPGGLPDRVRAVAGGDTAWSAEAAVHLSAC